MESSPADEPAPDIIEVVTASTLPVLILEVPSERIVAASPTARKLLEPIRPTVVGRVFEDFAQDVPTGGLELLAEGRINGYEARRMLKRPGRALRLWVHALDESQPIHFVLAVVMPEAAAAPTLLPGRTEEQAQPVIGSADARLIIDGISSDVASTLGFLAEDIVGTSLLALLTPTHIADILAALVQISRSHRGVLLHTQVVRVDKSALLVDLVLLPLVPPPSCTFALLPTPAFPATADGPSVSALLRSLSQCVRGASTSQILASTQTPPVPGLERLSSREADIASRLLAGDRVPAIAQQLFLSQGTVRNYLSTAFGKLGVKSQQELIALLRGQPK